MDDDRGLLRRMSEAALVEALRTITRAKDEDDNCPASEDEGNNSGDVLNALTCNKSRETGHAP